MLTQDHHRLHSQLGFSVRMFEIGTLSEKSSESVLREPAKGVPAQRHVTAPLESGREDEQRPVAPDDPCRRTAEPRKATGFMPRRRHDAA